MPVTIHPLAVPGPLDPGLDLLATLLAAAGATLSGPASGSDVDEIGVGEVALEGATPSGPASGSDGPGLRDGDVVAVASKVVALSEGRLVPAPRGTADTHRHLVLEQATRVVADHPRVLVVETAHGLVIANAGIDTSNVPPGWVVLLPEDPDASAARLRSGIRAATGATVGVVVTDTAGRPWREGQVDLAIGSAGITPLRDERGSTDLHGAPLAVTVAAVADEVAGAADLVRAKASAVPFVLVRGLDLAGSGTARDLVRAPGLDLFPAGGPTMATHLLDRVDGDAPGTGHDPGTGRAPGTGHDPASGPAVRGRVATAAGLVARALAAGVVATRVDPGDPTAGAERSADAPVRLDLVPPEDDAAGWLAVGRVVARLELLAAAADWVVRTDVDHPGHVLLHPAARVPNG